MTSVLLTSEVTFTLGFAVMATNTWSFYGIRCFQAAHPQQWLQYSWCFAAAESMRLRDL